MVAILQKCQSFATWNLIAIKVRKPSLVVLWRVGILKINASKFTRGLEPLYGDACGAKSLEVLTLVFSTDCSPIDWLQSVLKITRFEYVCFVLFYFLKIRRHVRGGVKLD